MIELIITLLVLALLLYVVNIVLAQLALPPVVRTIIWLVIAIVVVVWLLRQFGVAIL